MEIIKIFDDVGNPHEFYLVDTFGMDDFDYCVLQETDSDDRILLKIIPADNDEFNFIAIEDENEFQDAITIYEELKEEKGV